MLAKVGRLEFASVNLTLVYDIRADEPWDSGFGSPLVFLVLSVVLLGCALRSLFDRRPATPPTFWTRPRTPWWGFLVLAFVFSYFGVLTGLENYGRLDRRHIMIEQLEHGLCGITEGEVSQLRLSTGKQKWYTFVVNGREFSYSSASPAFRGTFNQPGFAGQKLHDGQHVRLHHEAPHVILQVEIVPPS